MSGSPATDPADSRLGAATVLRSAALPLLLLAVLLAALFAGRFALDGLRLPPATVDLALTAGVVALLLVAFLRWPTAALLAFALHMLFGETTAFLVGYGLARVDELFVPAALLITAIRVRPWRDRVQPLREGAVVVLVVLAIASSLLNGVPANVWLPGLVLLGKVIAFLYIAAWQQYDRAELAGMAAAVGAIGAVVVGLGYIEAIDPPTFRQILGLSDTGSPRGTLPSVKSIFYHPVLYGWFAAFVGLFMFAGYVVYRRWWLLVGALYFSAAVMLSARRRAIAGLFVALAGGAAGQWLNGVRGRPLLRSWVPVGAVMLLLFAVFWSGIGDLIERTQNEYGGPVTPIESPLPGEPVTPTDQARGQTTARELLYGGAIQVAAEHFPLGAGLGRYGSWMSRIEYSPIYRELGFDEVWGLSPTYPLFITDTFWPQILGEIGVLGVAAYLVFVVAVGWDLWRSTRIVRDPLLLVFCLAALMVFGHALVETLASSMFHSPPRIYLLFGAVGAALALLHAARRREA